MRYSYPLLLAGLLIVGCGSRPDFPWQPVSFAEALDLAGDRLLMLDFYTDG